MDTAASTPMTDRELSLRPPAHQVSPRAVWYWLTRAGVGWLIVIAVQIVAWVLDWPVPPWPAQVLTGTVLIAIAHLAVMPRLRYRVHRWELTEDSVYTRSGWLTQEWRIAPVTRIQTVDSERGPIGRLFHLTRSPSPRRPPPGHWSSMVSTNRLRPTSPAR